MTVDISIRAVRRANEEVNFSPSRCGVWHTSRPFRDLENKAHLEVPMATAIHSQHTHGRMSYGETRKYSIGSAFLQDPGLIRSAWNNAWPGTTSVRFPTEVRSKAPVQPTEPRSRWFPSFSSNGSVDFSLSFFSDRIYCVSRRRHRVGKLAAHPTGLDRSHRLCPRSAWGSSRPFSVIDPIFTIKSKHATMF